MFIFAFRNLWRNKRRSLTTMIAIVCGYAAISLFGGYIQDTYHSLQVQAISGERLGHLSIFKEGMLNEGKLRPLKYLFTEAEMQKVKKIVNDYPGVMVITPGLPISGIFNTDDASTIFIGDGIVPDDLNILRGELDEGYGGQVYNDQKIGIAIASDMARMLQMKEGGLPILITSTFTGQANAMDAEIVNIFETGNAGTNDKMILVPFEYAQTLMDTKGAQRFIVLLDNIENTLIAQKDLQRLLEDAGLKVEIKTWRDLSSFYNQVAGLFNMIFTFIFCIVFIVIVMSIINTMSMSVIERTREIGTLRALGLKRYQIVYLFLLEGTILAAIAVGIGALLSILVSVGIDIAHIEYTPPNSSAPVPLVIALNVSQMIITFLLTAFLSAIAAAWPSFIASRKPIHLALTHV